MKSIQHHRNHAKCGLLTLLVLWLTCTNVEQVPLGTHTIPKLIFDIDKSAYYKAILAIFLRIDFCIFRCQNKENPS